MASLILQEFDGLFNMSNTSISPFPEDDVSEATTLADEQVTVAESLQTTRFVVQGILTPVIVTVGLLGNCLNILVLFQPSMRTSTNVYLLVLSVADSVYLVVNFALSLLDCGQRGQSPAAYHFHPYGRFLSNFSGNVGVCVTVVFTVERYIAVCHPIHGKVWCTVSRAKLASLAVVVLALINTIPTIFELEVADSENGLRCKPSEFANSPSYVGYSWWYVTVFTFIPFICLAIFNTVLIRALLVASRKRQQLALISTSASNSQKANGKSKTNQNQQQLQITEISSSHTTSERSLPNQANVALTKSRQSRRMSREQNKVTLLLVTIVMIFFLCQLPWTAVYLYKTYLASNDIPGNITHLKIAGNICNMLGLLNASVNFYLYSCFSKRFRRTLAKLMLFWRRPSTSSPTTV